MKYSITYNELQAMVENDVGFPVNVCIFWNKAPFTTKAAHFEQANYRKLHWIGKKSTRLRPSPRDNGNTLTINDIPKLLKHYVKMKLLKPGEYEVLPT